MNRLKTALAFLLPAAGLAAGCELLAGIQDISYGTDASSPAVTPSADQASSGSQASGDDGQAQTTGAQQSGGSQSGGMGNSGAQSSGGQGGSGAASGVADMDVVQPTTDATTGRPQFDAATEGGNANSGGQDATADRGMSGTADSAPDVIRTCAPTPGTGGLPFVVDSVYAPSGAFGDVGSAVTTSVCATGRSGVQARGNCHAVTYTPRAGGFAGFFWQYGGNWGMTGGYVIPPGATKVTFFAKGAMGGEKVTFVVGYTGAPTPSTPCVDSIRGTTPLLTLTSTWTAYVIPITGGYAMGVLGPFGWVANAPAAPPDAAPPTVTFQVDDIQYQ